VWEISRCSFVRLLPYLLNYPWNFFRSAFIQNKMNQNPTELIATLGKSWTRTATHHESRYGRLSWRMRYLNPGCYNRSLWREWLEAFAGSFSAWTLQSIETLVSSGAKIQNIWQRVNTPPLIAAQNGNKRLVEYFLSKGGNLKIKDDADNSPTMQAVESQNCQVILLLEFFSHLLKSTKQ
jgi:ankyrin repeat protein